MYDYHRLRRIAEVEFPDIVVSAIILRRRKLRIIIIDSSILDVFLSPDPINRKYAFHWDRSFIDGTIYRHDNIPDGNWKNISTFPKHFHNGGYENVQESYLSDDTGESLREFLLFIRAKLKKTGR